jgi:hypothetical protein
MSDETVRDGRMLVQFYYYGGPLDGEPFEMGPGALVPESIGGFEDGTYVVDVQRARFTWTQQRAR